MLFVSRIFVAATIVYWLATLVATFAKWRLIKQSYDDLKNNYRDVLDDKDLTAAFGEDAALKSAKKESNQIFNLDQYYLEHYYYGSNPIQFFIQYDYNKSPSQSLSDTGLICNCI